MANRLHVRTQRHIEKLLLRVFDAFGRPLAVFCIVAIVVEAIAQIHMYVASHVVR